MRWRFAEWWPIGRARRRADFREFGVGLPGLLVHDLRRSAVRNLERAGVPRSTAVKSTGHKTENVYLRYAIVSDSDLPDGCTPA